VSEVQCYIRWHTGNVGVLFVNSYCTLMWREWSQYLELDFICRIWYSAWYCDSLICILNRHLALDLGSWSHAPDGGVRKFDDAAHLWVTPLRVRYYDTKKRWVGSQDLYFWELGCHNTKSTIWPWRPHRTITPSSITPHTVGRWPQNLFHSLTNILTHQPMRRKLQCHSRFHVRHRRPSRTHKFMI
jgi:hypothetical protein